MSTKIVILCLAVSIALCFGHNVKRETDQSSAPSSNNNDDANIYPSILEIDDTRTNDHLINVNFKDGDTAILDIEASAVDDIAKNVQPLSAEGVTQATGHLPDEPKPVDATQANGYISNGAKSSGEINSNLLAILPLLTNAKPFATEIVALQNVASAVDDIAKNVQPLSAGGVAQATGHFSDKANPGDASQAAVAHISNGANLSGEIDSNLLTILSLLTNAKAFATDIGSLSNVNALLQKPKIQPSAPKLQIKKDNIGQSILASIFPVNQKELKNSKNLASKITQKIKPAIKLPEWFIPTNFFSSQQNGATGNQIENQSLEWFEEIRTKLLECLTTHKSKSGTEFEECISNAFPIGSDKIKKLASQLIKCWEEYEKSEDQKKLQICITLAILSII